ncbi:PTS system sorbose subfamily IIB component [Thermoanaerobacterium thermosaccharolyticum DSM 571]|uniref:PTS system sorbose subfamily IIB component n=1 Tax=Thermoanaerobacterium thermosaccharolyticum (strain ATCC 7956 / DSM 571 / NCIMB 9385 / NCA 3814 / NCTC 13789 / WDCM 00135 / 2032) TaxID=580327 RepID=D9TTF1_THETC|nr:PTS sugar transporter subunit IIB [Thermoanaerobacterium thermosaccharolyticum]ADL69927.1 PTS system sorbose subfamily IIB component [Thermoanaerobacterium thermosaccharolyticum DSM 571]
MGEIIFARVDDRLIHGQVMTKWAKGYNCNSIFVIDDPLAKDEFMKNIYIMSASTANITLKILKVDESIALWEKDKFDGFKVILLFKNIKTVKETITKGLPIKKLNIGGIAKSSDRKFIIPTVSLNREEAEMLLELEKNYGVEVFFQTVPESKKVNLDAALDAFDLNK